MVQAPEQFDHETAATPAGSHRHNHITAIVSRGGRPDLASTNSLRTINAATMFIVGDKDSKVVIDINKKAFEDLEAQGKRD